MIQIFKVKLWKFQFPTRLQYCNWHVIFKIETQELIVSFYGKSIVEERLKWSQNPWWMLTHFWWKKKSPQNFFGIWITVCSFFFKLTYPKSQLNKYSAHTKRVLYWRSFQLKRCRNQQTWLITLDLPNVIWSRWWLIIPVIFMQIEKFFGRFFLEPERSGRKKIISCSWLNLPE